MKLNCWRFIGTDQQQCQDDYILALIRYMRFYQNDEAD